MWQSKDFSWTEIITSRRKLHVSVKLMFLKILSTQYVLNFECPQKLIFNPKIKSRPKPLSGSSELFEM